MQLEFETYRNAREADIQNRLARFRFERESELRDKMDETYSLKKQDWAERLELEFQSREEAARKAIMSEIDARLRNERLTHETDLELMKEETVLELELEMEERLGQFRSRKEEEVATQLERQLDKREEIMRNKALIEIRKREALIRAEIEAQLGIKRAEIRDRLHALTDKMDNFKQMAEEKLRASIEGEIEGEIEQDEARLKEQQEEFEDLQSQDNRVEKRQSWLQAIANQGMAPSTSQADPAVLGARANNLQAAAGRQSFGLMGNQQDAPQPTIGLAGMRAPQGSARTLISGTAPKPVRPSIINQSQAVSQPTVPLPRPVERIIRQPVQTPVQPQVEQIPTEVPTELPATTPETVVQDESLAESEIQEPEITVEPSTTMLTPVETLRPVSESATITPVEASVLKPIEDTKAPSAVITPVSGQVLSPKSTKMIRKPPVMQPKLEHEEE